MTGIRPLLGDRNLRLLTDILVDALIIETQSLLKEPVFSEQMVHVFNLRDDAAESPWGLLFKQAEWTKISGWCFDSVPRVERTEAMITIWTSESQAQKLMPLFNYIYYNLKELKENDFAVF